MICKYSILFLILGLIFTFIGGYLDIKDTKKFYISKEHFWNDGIVLILISIILQNYNMWYFLLSKPILKKSSYSIDDICL